jgi:hypothetical protein
MTLKSYSECEYIHKVEDIITERPIIDSKEEWNIKFPVISKNYVHALCSNDHKTIKKWKQIFIENYNATIIRRLQYSPQVQNSIELQIGPLSTSDVLNALKELSNLTNECKKIAMQSSLSNLEKFGQFSDRFIRYLDSWHNMDYNKYYNLGKEDYKEAKDIKPFLEYSYRNRDPYKHVIALGRVVGSIEKQYLSRTGLTL